LAGERGIGLLDAPVSGGAERALAGELTVMVGGEPGAVDRARPLLDAVGGDIRHVGPSGAGCVVKLANQLMMFSALAGVHEGLDLARAHGVDERAVLDAVATGTGDSWVVRNRGFFDDVARAYDDGGTPVRERPWSKDLWDVIAAHGPPTSRCRSRGCSRRCSPRASRRPRAGSELVYATAASCVMRQKHDDLIGTSARARATSSCCLTMRAGSGLPRRTRHSW
jgi:hypothetical protein